mmetsp:Transcript_54943/g.100390  ORF Transcript_54943/g.100390 Transcript_54943/m.100390 type:complete len:429 (-) Transcript_54943:61-1347(-)
MLELRYLFLVLLCLQNSAYTVLRRYSRGILQEKYSPSSVLAVSELLKFIIAAALVEGPNGAAQQEVSHKTEGRRAAVLHALRHSRPMAVPAAAYLIMNVLSFLAISRIDATVFAMIAQLKILLTAVCSRHTLGRSFSTAQWRAIWLLTLAVAIITYARGHNSKGSGDGSKTQFSMSFLVGCSMVLMEVTLSGWVSTYFERYLKDGSFSVWGRNLQLSVWSMVMYAMIELARYVAPALFLDGQSVNKNVKHGDNFTGILSDEHQKNEHGQVHHSIFALVLDPFLESIVSFFTGWSIVAVILCLLGGAGGLLVAFATKHADAVAKAMAAAFALVLVVSVDIICLGAAADPVVCMSALVAIIALQNYHEANQQATKDSYSPVDHKSPTIVAPAPIGAMTAANFQDMVAFSNAQASVESPNITHMPRSDSRG